MSESIPSPPSLSIGLTPAEAAARFEKLQSKLIPLWESIQQLSMEEQTIVVVPSMSVDSVMGSVMQAYEERFLFLLFLLRQPHAKMVYVTSQTILPSIIDYYLGLLPGVIGSHARRRLYLLSPLDSTCRPLSEKLLERPRFIERIRSLILRSGSGSPDLLQHHGIGTRSRVAIGHSIIWSGSEVFSLWNKNRMQTTFCGRRCDPSTRI